MNTFRIKHFSLTDIPDSSNFELSSTRVRRMNRQSHFLLHLIELNSTRQKCDVWTRPNALKYTSQCLQKRAVSNLFIRYEQKIISLRVRYISISFRLNESAITPSFVPVWRTDERPALWLLVCKWDKEYRYHYFGTKGQQLMITGQG